MTTSPSLTRLGFLHFWRSDFWLTFALVFG